MKKRFMALVVCVVLSVAMVTPCFAATTGITKWSDVAEDETPVVTTPVATPVQQTVVTPAPVATTPATVTPVVADANTQAIALQVTYNFVVQQFYGGDHQKAFNDLANYANLCNALYPQVLQVMQTIGATNTVAQ